MRVNSLEQAFLNLQFLSVELPAEMDEKTCSINLMAEQETQFDWNRGTDTCPRSAEDNVLTLGIFSPCPGNDTIILLTHPGAEGFVCEIEIE